MARDIVTIGSRGSELALWQAQWVERTLSEKSSVKVEIVTIKTKGDKILDSPLSRIGDKGLFTREIENALLKNEIDLAVHSLKDLPTELPQGLFLGAICRREDVRDVFIPHPDNPLRKLLDQPTGSTIATGSLRRKSQLLNLRPDFTIADIRGNLNTRMQKLEKSSWAGMILARAGVERLGWTNQIGDTLETATMLPAVGQGALGIEIRQGDDRVAKLVSLIHHSPTAYATLAERALLRRLEGGCQVPIGAIGRVESGTLMLEALVSSLDGRRVIRGKIHGSVSDAETLGRKLAEQLLASGAREILRSIRRTSTENEKAAIDV